MKARAVVYLLAGCICIISVLFIPSASAASINLNTGTINTINHVADESINIPEPKNNMGKVPNHIRWEPLLGCYIVKEAKYDPSTKSFIIPEPGLAYPESMDSEGHRIDQWLTDNQGSKDQLCMALIRYNQSLNENLTLSSLRLPQDNKVINGTLIPLGIPYLNEMMDFVASKKIFDVPLTYSIEQITGVSAQPDGMSYDDYEQTHDQWRANMKRLLCGVEAAVKNHEDTGKFGIFALPYLVDADSAGLKNYVASNTEFLSKRGFSMAHQADVSAWVIDNEGVLKQIRACVNNYK